MSKNVKTLCQRGVGFASYGTVITNKKIPFQELISKQSAKESHRLDTLNCCVVYTSKSAMSVRI